MKKSNFDVKTQSN